MGDVTEPPRRSGPGVGHRPRKNADATTGITAADLKSDDDVVALTALKTRLAEMLARPSILERDLATLSKDYRAVCVELKEAKARAEASTLGRGRGLGVSKDRSFDSDI